LIAKNQTHPTNYYSKATGGVTEINRKSAGRRLVIRRVINQDSNKTITIHLAKVCYNNMLD
jgi:hypothetical protein